MIVCYVEPRGYRTHDLQSPVIQTVRISWLCSVRLPLFEVSGETLSFGNVLVALRARQCGLARYCSTSVVIARATLPYSSVKALLFSSSF